MSIMHGFVSGDWGYMICHTPDAAAAIEAASENADITYKLA